MSEPPIATQAVASDNHGDDGVALKKKEFAEALAVLKEKGWNNPIPFNYQTVMGGSENQDDTRDQVDWLSQAVVYEWDDDYGEVGPPNANLERMLFESDLAMRVGNHVQALHFNITVFGPVDIKPVRNFDEAGLHPVMLDNVKLCRYISPTPIQAYTIPAVLTGHDVVGCAQTGSGKTAAYLIPILSKLMGKARVLAAPRPNPSRYNAITDRVRAEPLVLVMCPTRELACQIFDEARRFCYRTMLRPCVIYGGAPSRNQREQLEMGCDILVATPGRLVDFMSNMSLLSLARLKFTVIDEADELLSSGWEEAMEKLFQGSGKFAAYDLYTNADADHTYLMFSATFPKEARRLAREYMDKDYLIVKVGRVGSTHANINQQVIYVEESAKNQALYDLLFSGDPQRTLVFVNSKAKCDIVDDFLYNKGLPSTSIHSDRTQREREDALRAFRTAKCPIMVATGVSARGLDVANVKHVINYDLPSTQHSGITEYIHRIGRTARIGNEGKATSFYNDRNEDIADDIVKVLVEAKQEVPDFLQDRIPEGPVEWHDGTDDEDEPADADGGFGGIGFGESGFGNDAGGNGFGGGFGGEDSGGFDANADSTDKVGSW